MSTILASYDSDTSGRVYDIVEGKDGTVYCTCFAWKRYKKCKHLDRWFNEGGKQALEEEVIITRWLEICGYITPDAMARVRQVIENVSMQRIVKLWKEAQQEGFEMGYNAGIEAERGSKLEEV